MAVASARGRQQVAFFALAATDRPHRNLFESGWLTAKAIAFDRTWVKTPESENRDEIA